MPTTAKGTPYVVSTDLVANYPTVSSDLADHIDDNLAYNAVSINAQTGSGANAYTFALADASEGKLVTASNAAAATYTVPPQSSVTWAAGAVLRILNQGAGVVTIAAGSGVTINGTPLTLAQYKGAALQRTASNTWTIIPFSGGVGNANFSDAATGTYTSGGISYKYKTYNSSGTITFTEVGLCDVLIVAGGGCGGHQRGGGGAAGQVLYQTSVYIPTAQAYTVTIGAGAASSAYSMTQGGKSEIVGLLTAIGGAGGGQGLAAYEVGQSGIYGSGGSGFTPSSGTVLGGAGFFTGGSGTHTSGSFSSAGGGAGANANGANATGGGAAAGAGGAGVSNSITGSAVTYGGGGGGGSQGGTAGAGGAGGGGAGSATNSVAGTAGTANTGGGGGGGGLSANGGSGGSGVIIVRVAT